MLSKVIITWNNYVEAVITDKPFRVIEDGKSKVAWIETVNPNTFGNYPTPYPFTSIEVIRLDVP